MVVCFALIQRAKWYAREILFMACRGVLFALTDEQAQRLLAAGSDEQVGELVEEIEEAWDTEHLAQTDKAWDAIHRCLSDGTLNFEGGEYPLNRCILGGKQLHEEDDYIVSFVRPEEVRDVAAALQGVTEPWFRERFFGLAGTDFPQEYIDAETLDYALAYLEEITEFYQKAAQANRAVIFTVDQ
jgi:hypothetical protein